ncbi:MAG: hypothetical protein DRI52_07920, partial [Chloroflexi bacterium]
EWCSAAEGQRWAKIMRQVEELRAGVTAEEVEQTIEVLREAKVPVSSKVWKLKEPTPATLRCLRCGHEWQEDYSMEKAQNEERMCAKCRSNSVRVLI